MARTEGDVVLDQPGGNLTLDLYVVTQHLGRMLDVALAPIGLSASMYAVYGQLAQGPLTPTELCTILGVRPTTVSGYLAAILRAGHATKSRSESDRRSWEFQLTPTGRQVAAEGAKRMRHVVTALNTALGGPDAALAARRMLGSIDDAIQTVQARL